MTGINSVSFCWLQRQIAKILVLALVAPLAHASAVPRSSQDQATQTQQQTPAAATNTAQPALPNAPQNHSQSTSQQQPPAPVPVGTAAAPLETPVGTAVSRPSGAAIAPAKQKRSHTFLIRVGLVVGAAVAVGTVVALSKASRSRP